MPSHPQNPKPLEKKRRPASTARGTGASSTVQTASTTSEFQSNELHPSPSSNFSSSHRSSELLRQNLHSGSTLQSSDSDSNFIGSTQTPSSRFSGSQLSEEKLASSSSDFNCSATTSGASFSSEMLRPQFPLENSDFLAVPLSGPSNSELPSESPLTGNPGSKLKLHSANRTKTDSPNPKLHIQRKTLRKKETRCGITVKVQGEELELLPEKAFFWQKQSLLGLSDVHLGKAESYQALGVPMPSGSHLEDLQAITDLIENYDPNTIVILGDWIHQKTSWTEQIESDLQTFFQQHRLREWILILGNHEKGSLEYLRRFPIKLVMDDLKIGPITLAHGHQTNEETFSIQGHIHPVIKMREGSTNLRLPAFVLRKNLLILPSFGSQTGGHAIKINSKDRLFATTGTSIFELPPSMTSR